MIEPFYTDDAVTIYHGDARDVLPQISADVIVTDPPYGIGWKRGNNAARGSKAHAGIANDEDTSVRDAVLLIRPDLPAVVFGSFYAPYPPNVRQVLVWPKPVDAGVVGSTTGFRRDVEPVFLVGPWPQRTVERGSLLSTGARSMKATTVETPGHPHVKPLGVMREIIGFCPPGVIVDPFMGSGSTLRAAKDLGRRAVGVEIEERYCELARARLSQDVLDLGRVA